MKPVRHKYFTFPCLLITIDRNSDNNILDFEATLVETSSRCQLLKWSENSIAIRCGDTIEYFSLEDIIEQWLNYRSLRT